MISFKFALIGVIFLFLFSACSSNPSGIRFLSSPDDAEVSVIDSNGVATIIGKTPLVSSESDVYKGSARYSQIKISKTSYAPAEVVLTKSLMGSDTIVNVQLKKDESSNQNFGEQTLQ